MTKNNFQQEFRMYFKLIIFILFFITKASFSQLRIDTSLSVKELVQKKFVKEAKNLIIKNVNYTGALEAIGYFYNPMKYNKFIQKGIIISTGNVFNAIGPNDVPNKSSETFNFGDNDINKIVNGKTFDAAVLDIEFISLTDSISFNFFFASEEYPEYVKKNVNDMFAFFLINKKLNVKKNLALLPSSNTPISIDNINSSLNSKYFIKNETWANNNISKWISNKQLGELSYTFQFDGFSTLLSVGSKVIPNQIYHLKMVIADVGDRLYDSAIFLEANSFNSQGNTSDDNETFTKNLIERKFSENIAYNSDTMITVRYKIKFNFDSDIITGNDSYMFLDEVYNILKNDTSIYLKVHGYTDNIGTREYNRTLSKNRAKNVAEYIINKGIKRYKIKYYGFGDSNPISKSNKSLNRRVEFIFLKNKKK